AGIFGTKPTARMTATAAHAPMMAPLRVRDRSKDDSAPITGQSLGVLLSRTLEEDRAQEVRSLEQLVRRSVEADFAPLHEIRVARDGQRDVHRLLDHDDAGPLVVDGAHHVEQLPDDDRREPE